MKKLIPKRVRAHISLRLFNTWVLEGRPQGCSDVLRVLFGGSAFDKAYITRRMFDGDVREYYQGRKMRWMTDAAMRRLHCEMSITPTARLSGFLRSDNYEYLIPSWLNAEAELKREDVYKGRSRSRRRDIRQLAKNDIHYEITTEKQALLAFFDDMYLPTMKSSHGAGALLMGRDQMLQRLEEGKCELLVIKQKQRLIAGSLIAYDGEIPRLWSSGVREADRRYLRIGAGNAIYLYSFRYLLERGYNSVNIGLSRAFLSDGALYFKKRLGITLTGASTNVFAIRFGRPSAAVRSCLSANPFVCVDGSVLHVAVFVPADNLRDAASWRAIWDSNYLPGIKKLIVNAFQDSGTQGVISIPPDIRGQIDLRCIDIDPVRV